MIFRYPQFNRVVAFMVLVPGLLVTTLWAQQQSVTTEQLKEEIDSYFADLKATFDQIAEAPAVKRTSLAQTDRYFVSALRLNQAFYTFIKTNSKGVVISEVIRGQKPERNFRNISKQQWYSRVERTRQEYQGLLKEENGRYYLFWSKPVLKGNNGAFVGAVVAKIDLWDCFHLYANNVFEPFLIRVKGFSLYSNKWQGDAQSHELALNVPGVDAMFVRSAQRDAAGDGSAVTAPTATAPPPPAQPAPDTVTEQKEAVSAVLKNRTFWVIASIAFLIILVFSVRLLVQINHWRLMRKIDKSDIL